MCLLRNFMHQLYLTSPGLPIKSRLWTGKVTSKRTNLEFWSNCSRFWSNCVPLWFKCQLDNNLEDIGAHYIWSQKKQSGCGKSYEHNPVFFINREGPEGEDAYIYSLINLDLYSEVSSADRKLLKYQARSKFVKHNTQSDIWCPYSGLLPSIRSKVCNGNSLL